ncbi:MAG: sulfatase-like hydrolase/transferase, partial [Anaerolineaceae bacterium]|nr:sulfatase-like hydrolase/transferase [Anaerolineaceae bacterium]
AEISVDYYADPSVFNLQDSFVMMNGRSDTIGRLYTFSRTYIPEDAAYFLSMIAKRYTDRLFHIFAIRTMPNPYGEVRQKLSNMTDEDRIGQIISLFRDIRQPLFIHVHLMGTHTNDDEIYRQGILDFDQNMRSLVNELEQMGRLEETVIVVYTDHGYANVSHERIPLMFRFPNGEYRGQIVHNTQNLDIAPTILDYIGIQPPEWMGGQSLLDGEPPLTRPIFSAAPNFRADENNLMQLDLSKVQPPFYQFGVIQMIICQKWYAANTTTLTWQEGEVRGYQQACPAGDLPGTLQAQDILFNQLKNDGFDTTSLEAALRK